MRDYQRGQALPLGIALILFGILGGLVLYNTGQTASDKARLVNTADAAAFSGVQWQARALNFQAYTNRAMVANQVSMAQAVTLSSWTTYGMIMSENIERVLSAIPFVNAIASGVAAVMGGINQVVAPIAEAMLTVIDKVNLGIGASQEAMFLSSFAATPEIVRAVVKSSSNDRFTADTAYSVIGALGNLQGWDAFTDRVGTDEEDYGHMRERAQIIRDSQDEFTKSRDWKFFDNYLYIAPLVKINIEKQGETRLIERETDDGLEWEWKAKDTQSFHTKIKRIIRSDKHIEVPIGWGEAIANNSAGDDITISDPACTDYNDFWNDDCEHWLAPNETSEQYADANINSLNGTESRVEMDGYSGLRAFRRLSDETVEKNFPVLKLRVEVALPFENAASSNRFVGSGELFETALVARGDLLSSISIAEVYFKPPDADRTVGELEFASAYSPWWDVRLSPISADERLAAFALRSAGSSVPSGGSVVINAGAGLDDYDADSGEQVGPDELAGGFAEALGSDGSYAALAGRSDGQTSLAGAVGAAFGDRVGDGIEQIIRDQLEQVMHEAVAQILAGIVNSETGQQAATTVDELEAQANAIEDGLNLDEMSADVDEALEQIEALQAEYARVDQVLNDEYGPYFEQTVDEWLSRTSGLRAHVSASVNRPLGPFEIPSAASVEDGEREAIRRLRDERARLIRDLAEEFARVSNDATELFTIDERMARQVVTVLLEVFADSDGEPIDFGLFDDADHEPPPEEQTEVDPEGTDTQTGTQDVE